MHTDKSEDTGMGLHIRSAGSFHGFRVSRRDVKSCLEKSFDRVYPALTAAATSYIVI